MDESNATTKLFFKGIPTVAHASDFFLWNFQTVGLYIYALEGLECLGLG